MTTKAKLATVALVCGVVFATLWALQEPSGDPGQHDPMQDPGGGRLVAEGEGSTGKLATPAAKEPAERTEVPTRPVARSKLGSLLVRAIWADDKKPAEGVLLTTWHSRGYSPSDRHSGFSDQNGRLRLENMQPGRLFVQSYRGDLGASGQKRALIEAGKETQVEIVIPVGLNLDGIVVDQGGNPVADATLIVAPASGWSGGYAKAIGKSEADGSFRLRALGARCAIGARARGHAPSLLHKIDEAKGSNHRVRLVLGGRGGDLRGRVLDPNGKPVRDAIVQVGVEARSPQARLPDGSFAFKPVPVQVHSDAEGHFVAAGLAPGRFPVAVAARGLAPWDGMVDVVTDGDSELLVHLLPGATLSGTVRDGNGEPLAKAVLHVESKHRIFNTRWMRTGADGKFRIEGLGVGKLKVYAESQGSRMSTEFAVIAGQALQWNPVIRKGLVLRGRVVDEQDRPVAKMQIMASLQNPGKDRWYRHLQTDKEGRFALNSCVPGKKIRIHVYSYPRHHADKQLVVEPDEQNLVIRLQSLGKPSVYITGQVLGPDGKPVKHCRIRPYSRKHYVTPKLITDAADGRFKLGPNPPGEYGLTIEPRGYATMTFDFKKLARNETWDLGVIRLERPGYLQVTLKGKTSLLPKNLWFTLQKGSGKPFASVRCKNGKVERSNPITPGTYYLQVVDKNYACGRHRFEIQSGQETRLDVPLQRGTRVVLEFEVQVGGKTIPVPTGGITTEIQDTAGNMKLTRSASFVRDNESLRRIELALRPGSYSVTAKTVQTGARGEATFTVGDKPAAKPKRIVLR